MRKRQDGQGTQRLVNRKNLCNSPSPSGRELEGGGIHPHVTPDLIRGSPIKGEEIYTELCGRLVAGALKDARLARAEKLVLIHLGPEVGVRKLSEFSKEVVWGRDMLSLEI